MTASSRRRVAVIIPCYRDGQFVTEAVQSVDEPESIELVVVDDGSTDDDTVRALSQLERKGVRVLRHPRNLGVAEARMTGLAATSAPFVAPLDADDLAEPGALAAMADALDAAPNAAACVGDYVEFGQSSVMRAVPDRLDPFRVAYTNEYPITGVFRRSALEAVGGWTRRGRIGYEDWGLWMSLAEHGATIVHLGAGRSSYRRRIHGTRLNAVARRSHTEKYRALRAAHPVLFAHLADHRRRTDLSAFRRVLYPLVYGERPAVPFERLVKPLADRLGVLTLTRRDRSTEPDR